MNCNRMPEMGSSIYINGCSCSCLWNEMQDMEKPAADSVITATSETEDCSDGCMTNDDFASWPVGMTYVPMQHWEEPFDLVKGLRAGTIFPSLRKPFRGGGR